MLYAGVVDDLQGYFPAGGPAERQGPRGAHPLPFLLADFPPERVVQLLQVLVPGVGQIEQGSLEALQVVVGVGQDGRDFPVVGPLDLSGLGVVDRQAFDFDAELVVFLGVDLVAVMPKG